MLVANALVPFLLLVEGCSAGFVRGQSKPKPKPHRLLEAEEKEDGKAQKEQGKEADGKEQEKEEDIIKFDDDMQEFDLDAEDEFDFVDGQQGTTTLGDLYDDELGSPSQVDVVIVGGGWAGLAALDDLKDEGFNVLLLEARDSLGGRSRTIHDFVPGVATELGSSWLYEKTIAQELANELQVNYGYLDYFDDWSYLGLYTGYPTTERKAQEDDTPGPAELSLKERETLLKEAWEGSFIPFSRDQAKSIKEVESDVPYQTVLDQYFSEAATDSLLTNQTRQFLQTMVHSQLALEYAAPLTAISTREVGEQVNECIFCAGAFLYTAVPESQPGQGGFGRLIEALAEPHLDSILTGSRVTKIQYADPYSTVTPIAEEEYPVTVTYTGVNNTEQTVTAQKVLVTVSVGVLKGDTIEFVPPLPDWKQSAIDQIGMGVINKCILYWDETIVAAEDNTTLSSWWPEDRSVLTFIPGEDNGDENHLTAGLWTTFFNDRNLVPVADDDGNDDGSNSAAPYILTAWIGGAAALYSEAFQSDQEVVETVMKNLRAMFAPQDIPDPTRTLVTRWGQDDLAFGAFSYIPVGIDVESVKDDLINPVDDRLFFAGEATSEDYGTTFGAHDSGRQAAELIRKSFK